MKHGISIHWGQDYKGQTALIIEKARGKLTLDDIQDAILYNPNSWGMYGYYAIVLNCNEGADTPTWGDELEEKQGDVVLLYQVAEGEECPVCGHVAPPYRYCPECGHDLRKESSK